jgi:hypothetical protein
MSLEVSPAQAARKDAPHRRTRRNTVGASEEAASPRIKVNSRSVPPLRTTGAE